MEKELLEIARFEFDGRPWRVASASGGTGPEASFIEEYVVEGTSIDHWDELLSINTVGGLQHHPLATVVEALKAPLLSRLIDGKLDWRVVGQSDDSLDYTWSLRGDLVIPDQLEAVRLLRGQRSLQRMAFSTKRQDEDPGLLNDWLGRFRSARLVEIEPRRVGPPPLTGEQKRKFEEILGQLSAMVRQPRPQREQAELSRQLLTMVRRASMPDQWALFHYFLGLGLLADQGSVSAEKQEEAISALRTAAEAYQLRPGDDKRRSWAICVALLGRTFLLRKRGERAQNLARALTASRRAIEVLDPAQDSKEWADAALTIASALIEAGPDEQGRALAVALDVTEAALRVYTREPASDDWARATLIRGDVHRVLGSDPHHLDNAIKAYREVEEAATLTGKFQPSSWEAGAILLNQAQHRFLQAEAARGLDRQAAIIPSLSHAEMRGTVLYLRPFDESPPGLPGRFRDPGAMQIRFPQEPSSFTLEAALSRVLAPHVYFAAFGGQQDAYGAARQYSMGGDGDWKKDAHLLIRMQIETQQPIFIAPGTSPGVRWEIETTKVDGALRLCIFVMPPMPARSPVQQEWQAIAEVMRQLGLELPEQDETGIFFKLSDSGQVSDVWPFQTVWDDTLIEYLDEMLPLPQNPAEEVARVFSPAEYPPSWSRWMDVVDCGPSRAAVRASRVWASTIEGARHRHGRAKYFGMLAGGQVEEIAEIEAVVDIQSGGQVRLVWRNVEQNEPELLKRARQWFESLPGGPSPSRVYLLGQFFATSLRCELEPTIPSDRRYLDVGSMGTPSIAELAKALEGRNASDLKSWPTRRAESAAS